MKKPQLHAAMLADLQRSGLDHEDAKVLQLSVKPHTLKPASAGYVIPYFSAAGRVTKFFRVRYVESTTKGFNALTGRKPLRYNQPPNTVNEVYLPPFIGWADYFKTSHPIVITEGEKKSAKATKEGIPTIGLGGVWCFMSTKAGQALLPVFKEMNLKDRPIYICYDSDAATNPDIVAAEAALARRLVDEGAHVYIARIPHSKHGKRGMDDYILEYDAHKFKRNVLNNAYEYEGSRALHDMNQDVVYLRKVGIIFDHVHNMRLSPMAFTQHSHSNVWIDTTAYDKDGNAKLVRKSAAKMWMEWEHRAELSGLTYAPGQPRITEQGDLNMWEGWGVEDPVKGDVSLWHELLDSLFLDTEPEARDWFECWCAYPIQNPGAKMASAVVMWGASQGTGKTLCGHTLMRLYGDNATEVKDADLADARFAWAENKQFVLADDITGQNNRKQANMFKTMTTQKTLHINPKYVPSYTVPDRINYYFTSNDPDAFYLDDGDRRFFIHEVLSNRLPEDLRKRYIAWMNKPDSMRHLFHYMLTLDLGEFDPQAAALNTAAKHDMTHISKSELGVWVFRLKHEPDHTIGSKLKGDLFTAEELHAVYDPLGDKRASANALAREMKRAGFIRLQRAGGSGIRVAGRQLKLYAIRNIDKWRKATLQQIVEHYEQHHKMPKEKF